MTPSADEREAKPVKEKQEQGPSEREGPETYAQQGSGMIRELSLANWTSILPSVWEWRLETSR